MRVTIYRFGPFELDPRAGELRKHGVRIRLQEQPLQILLMLLANSGEAVLREEIQQKLWPNDTVVEFDHGINSAIKRLRTALGDSPENPRYVETLARRGYRFIAAVESVPAEVAKDEPLPVENPAPPEDPPEPLPEHGEFTGRTLGHYRVLEKLGSGGMGIVFRAEDLALGRQVALKFLNGGAAEAAGEALERFRREARATAALNHPHICTVYAVEEVAGQPVIAMELLEGETLAARLSKGPIPFSQTARLGIQMAQALHAGHCAGIVHRDFKPANVMLTRTGAKILDFGLARMMYPAPADEESETRRLTVTQAGAIVGTPQYMAPEQIQGKEADARSDIFAFGAVLYEMACGERPFEGASRASIFAATLESQPPSVSSLQPSVPIGFERLVNACLAKDPDRRKQNLHDVALDLEWIAEEDPARGDRPKSHRHLLWGVLGVSSLLAGAIFFVLAWRASLSPSFSDVPVHFLIEPPRGMTFAEPSVPYDPVAPAGVIAISPDGSKLVAVVKHAQGSRRLWVRSLSSLAERILPDTDEASLPFWSPDSKSIGFFAHEKLKTIAAAGGPAQALSDAVRPGGGDWNTDGSILFHSNVARPLYLISSMGGTRREVPGSPLGVMPRFLRDGRHYVYSGYSGTSNLPGASGVRLGSLTSAESQPLFDNRTVAAVAGPDYLLFLRDGRLLAQRLDVGGSRLIGEPVPLGSEGNEIENVGAFSASQNRVVVYRTGRPFVDRQLIWHSRDGRQTRAAGEPGRYFQVFLSPDEKLAVVNLAKDGPNNLWLLHFDTNVLERLTSESRPGYSAIDGSWSPDSRQLVYQIFSQQKTTMMVLRLGEHSPRVLYEDGKRNYPDDWSPDGKWILSRRDATVVFILSPDGNAKPQVILDTPGAKDQLQFSPDGQWVAYNSVQSGQWEVYVSRFPTMTETRQVSNSGGCQPIWRRDGKEVFYLTRDAKLMSVPVTLGSTVQAGAPKLLFPTGIPVLCSVVQYAAASNGERFLMIEPARAQPAEASGEPLHVITNWTAGLPR